MPRYQLFESYDPRAPRLERPYTPGRRRTVPWVTFSLALALTGVYLLEVQFPITTGGDRFQITPATVLAFGGIQRELITSGGQWYRLLIATFLHFNPAHVGANVVAILLAGFTLERHTGHRWLLAIFVLGALGGALMSFILLQPGSVAAGASGGAVALFAALFIVGFRMPNQRQRMWVQARAAFVIAASLVPTVSHSNGIRVDYAGHLGGALTGLTTILMVIAFWPDPDQLPGLRPRLVAGGLCVAAITMLTVGAANVFLSYPDFRIAAAMIPTARMPKTEVEQLKLAPELLQEYPNDPRAHFYMGRLLDARHEGAAAEREYRLAFILSEGKPALYGDSFIALIRMTLIRSVEANGRHAAARDLARPLCAAPTDDIAALRNAATLRALKLCD
jgi:rhomboid protease GluP